MTKVGILGIQAEMKETIKALHDLGVYHIKEANPEDIDIGNPLPEAERIDETLVTAKSLKSNWGIEGEVKRELNADEAIAKINNIQEQHNALLQEHEAVNEQIETLLEQEKRQRVLDKAGLDSLPEMDALTYYLGTINNFDESRIRDVTTAYDYERIDDTILLVADAKHKTAIDDVLTSFNYTPLPAEHDVSNDIQTLREQRDKLETQITELKQNKRQAIIDATAALKDASEQAEAPLAFAVTENTFYVEGYTPEDEAATLQQRLENATDNKVYVEEQPLDDDVPTKFNNPQPAQPFESIMELYSLPRYNEIDPTTITAFTFPLLFGFMLGDIGYGLVLLILASALKRYYDVAFFDILSYSALATILFGIFFGEVFGYAHMFGYELPHVMHRMGHSEDLLYVSIGFGIFHLNLGFITGFINAYQRHGLQHALLEQGGWFLLEGAALSYAFTYFYNTPLTYGTVLLLAAITTIYAGEGITGVVEIPSLFSNTLSYARLMAIGLASAGLAIVVNGFVHDLVTQGIIGIIAAVLVFVIGHAINVCLGILGPTLHSLRLHYVEFFTKFFEGGGKPFKAFGGR